MAELKVAILVPRREDGGLRDKLWRFARKRWENDFADWPIVEGHHTDGPFNRSAAVNAAAVAGGDWGVALIIDADVLANREAVLTAVETAGATNRVVVSHNERVMLTQRGTQKILNGFDGPWRGRGIEERVYTDSVSCAIAVPRALFDLVGGFDERFSGWGFEDSAFQAAVETLTGRPFVRLTSELFHLFHPPSPEADRSSPTAVANAERLKRYRDAWWKPDDIKALLAERFEPDLAPSRIPRILHRTVPAETSDEIETWWTQFQRLHPGWEFRTYREPIDPKDWPLTGDLWRRCQNGAQKAGLIRLEALFTHGGVYVDADVEPVRSFEPLLHVPAFAGWEDETTAPDAVLGAEPNHPAYEQMIAKARASIEGGGDAWQSGPGVTTEVLPNRSDVLVLPPGAFYPAHYLEKKAIGTRNDLPWIFCEHKWHHSWGTKNAKESIAKRQR